MMFLHLVHVLFFLCEPIVVPMTTDATNSICSPHDECVVLISAPWSESSQGAILAFENASSLVKIDKHVPHFVHISDISKDPNIIQSLMITEVPTIVYLNNHSHLVFDGIFDTESIVAFVETSCSHTMSRIDKTVIESIHGGSNRLGQSSFVLVNSEFQSDQSQYLLEIFSNLLKRNPHMAPLYYSDDPSLCKLLDTDCARPEIFAYTDAGISRPFAHAIPTPSSSLSQLNQFYDQFISFYEENRMCPFFDVAALLSSSSSVSAHQQRKIVLTVVSQREKALFARQKDLMRKLAANFSNVFDFAYLDPISIPLFLSSFSTINPPLSSFYSSLRSTSPSPSSDGDSAFPASVTLNDLPFICILDVPGRTLLTNSSVDVVGETSIADWLNLVISHSTPTPPSTKTPLRWNRMLSSISSILDLVNDPKMAFLAGIGISTSVSSLFFVILLRKHKPSKEIEKDLLVMVSQQKHATPEAVSPSLEVLKVQETVHEEPKKTKLKRKSD
ncbi:hypothetical protein BLNAU_18718 [Blattamonas nauphoetae]|uniref:Thioredoxin domain-containing protein n=1 Tax=Blattamonas nauphoetae TaxID=2049346 RepID=A0ABQ9X3V1_9EUKA|nr:hypothetical protein BLNAU_18718 [Blattamonas nauphoetae]